MEFLTVHVLVKAPLERVWACWTAPDHITHWNFASEDWHCPKAENTLVAGGGFAYTMAAKDGSFSFIFRGTYDIVETFQRIEYFIEDGRKVKVTFEVQDSDIRITEIFEPEAVHSQDQQKAGWQAILGNFKKYVEGLD